MIPQLGMIIAATLALPVAMVPKFFARLFSSDIAVIESLVELLPFVSGLQAC